MSTCDKCGHGEFYRMFISKKKYHGIPKRCFECTITKEHPNGTNFIQYEED